MQRKRSRPVGVDDDGDDLTDPSACALCHESVEQVAADAEADGMRCDVDRILHGVPVRGSRLPRHAVGIADDLVADGGGQKRQSLGSDGGESALPFGVTGIGGGGIVPRA